jgi:hypothetical protein
MRNQITDYKFFHGGKAIFTVSNPQGDHYTFKIHKPIKSAPFFVTLLTGPDNTQDYVYMGLFIPQHVEVRLTEKSKYKEDSTPVKVIRWAIKRVYEKKPFPQGYAIQHEGKCCRCGRMLTDNESIERGIGPECAKKEW